MKWLTRNPIRFFLCILAIGVGSDCSAQTTFTQELSSADKEAIKLFVDQVGIDSAYKFAQIAVITATVKSDFGVRDSSDEHSLLVAVEVLDLIEHDKKDNTWYYYNKAMGLQYLSKYEQAIMTFSKAIELNPTQASFFRERGKCKMNIHNCYGAIPDFTKAISLDPKDAKLYSSRSTCYVQTEEYDAAFIDINKAISLNAKDPTYYLTRGLIHMIKNRTKEGCLDLTKAGDMGSSYAFELLKEYCTGK